MATDSSVEIESDDCPSEIPKPPKQGDYGESVTEIDLLWEQRVYSKSRSTDDLSVRTEKQAIERYELERIFDIYSQKNPDLSEEDLAEVKQHVEKIHVLAYDDKAPPMISLEELETFMTFEREEKYFAGDVSETEKRGWNSSNNKSYSDLSHSRNSSDGYLHFLYKTHWKRNSDLRKRQRRETQKQRSGQSSTTPQVILDESNWMRSFSKCHQRHQKSLGRSKMAAAMRCGIPLVLDNSYDSLMNQHEKKELARQIIGMVDFLKDVPEPFHLYVTNHDESGLVANYLNNTKCQVTTTAASFTQIFPRSNLVYLSPDAQQDLEDFNPDDIFIIGGLVDKRMKRFCSLQRANKAGVRCAKFPLQDNARVIAAKPMNFLEVLTILHRFTYHKDIHRAIVEGISPRRIRKPEQAQDLVTRQVQKAERLFGDPTFVKRERERAQRRYDIVQRLHSLGKGRIRTFLHEPHKMDAWI